MSPPRRPALRWHGGKWLLAPWIIDHLPAHRVYVESYGGAASVMLRKPRAYAEIYNDLDAQVVRFFRVIQNQRKLARLNRLLRVTPFARAEFELAYELSGDEVEEARRLVVRSFMGFGSDGHNRAQKTGFRANSNRSGSTPAHDWQNYPDNLAALAERMMGVIIEQRPAIDVMLQHDGADTLHYVDPPYLPETRSTASRRGGGQYHAYAHELSNDDHDTLLLALHGLQGMVVLSGYQSEKYEGALGNWRRIERVAFADGARARTEILWLNPRAVAGLHQQQLSLVPHG